MTSPGLRNLAKVGLGQDRYDKFYRIVGDPTWHLVILFAVAIVLGGGGVGAGVHNLVVQLAAVVVMALNGKAFVAFFLRRPTVFVLLVAATVLLPLLQLVPLPPDVWSGLPGREMAVAARNLAGGHGWFPLSLDAARTATAAIGLLVPLTIVVVAFTLTAERLRWLVQAVVAMGLLAMLYGGVCITNPDLGLDYGGTETWQANGTLLATFADRNACGLFFDACLLLLIALPTPGIPALRGLPSDRHMRRQREKSWLIADMVTRGIVGCLLLTAVVLTQSRTAIVLLLVPLILLGMRLLAVMPDRSSAATRTGMTRGMMAGAILAGLLVVGLAGVGVASVKDSRIADVINRFDKGADGLRAEMREDSLKAAGRYWPVGAGMGTFDEVFQVDESLEYVSSRTAGRAHMDYYELAIEAGAAGLLLAAAWLVWLAVASWTALRRLDWMALAGTGIAICIAAQSLLSFPLRNQTMLAMAALAIALLHKSTRPREERL